MKELKDYTDRELLEFIVSNQVLMEKYIYELNGYMVKKYKGNENQLLLDEAYKNLLDSQRNLKQQILVSKSSEKD